MFEFQRLFLIAIVLMICSAVMSLIYDINDTIISVSFYAIVVDAGSTGSRAFIVNITEHYDRYNKSIIVARSLSSVKGKKLVPGVSDYISNLNSNTNAVVEYLLPIFVHASEVIPPIYHNSTQVYIKGSSFCSHLIRLKVNCPT